VAAAESAVVAANRVYADIVELVERALAWLDAIPPQDRLRRTGLTSAKFAWIPPWFRTTLFP
jgi:hypothetical protein